MILHVNNSSDAHPSKFKFLKYLRNAKMPNSLKKMLASFEALNVSSIQPLPPIKPDPSSPEKKFNFKSDTEEETQLHKIKKNDKKVLPSVVPRPAGVGYNGRYEFYINDRIPTEKGPLNEPLFELTKKDQMKAQRHIHKKIVDNDMTKRKSLKLDED